MSVKVSREKSFLDRTALDVSEDFQGTQSEVSNPVGEEFRALHDLLQTSGLTFYPRPPVNISLTTDNQDQVKVSVSKN